MRLYHGTSDDKYQKALNNGFIGGFGKDRIWLSTDKREAIHYGNTVVRVEYNPFLHPNKNNYCDGCWQLRVYEPIYDFKKIVRATSCGRTIHQLVEYKNHKGFLYDCKGTIFIECGHGCKKDFSSFTKWHYHITKYHQRINYKDDLGNPQVAQR